MYCYLDPTLLQGYVYRTDRMNREIPQYAVKMITFPVGSQEAEIYELLDQRGLTAATHTLPATVLRAEGLPPVIVLPLVSDLRGRYDSHEELPDTLRHFAQILTVRKSRNCPQSHVAHPEFLGCGPSASTTHRSLGAV